MNATKVRDLTDTCFYLLDSIQYKQNEEAIGNYVELKEVQLRRLARAFQENFELLKEELEFKVSIV